MRWLVAAAALAAALTIARAGAQEPALRATVVPDRVTVGDPIALTITTQHPAGAAVAGPDDPDVFLPLDLLEIV